MTTAPRLGIALNKAAAFERPEHLADARARHAKFIRQLVLAQLGAGRDFLLGDAPTQDVEHLHSRVLPRGALLSVPATLVRWRRRTTFSDTCTFQTCSPFTR